MNKASSNYFLENFASHPTFLALLKDDHMKADHLFLIGSDDFSGDAEFEYLDIYDAVGNLVHEIELTDPIKACLRELNGHLEHLCHLQKNSHSPHNHYDWTVIIRSSDISPILNK